MSCSINFIANAEDDSMYRLDSQFFGSLDLLLEIICRKLQLSQTQYDLADQHYHAVSSWLEREDSLLSPYRPVIYPQGSLPMGTTNKPIGRDEYDLDFICLLLIGWWQILPTDLLSKVEFRLRQHKDYADRIQRGKRCIRLTYAGNFHLDIVPACSNEDFGDGQIRVPDRQTQSWRDSNSKQYIQWFNHIAEDYAEALPPQELFEAKSILKFVVQIFKRQRDLVFAKTPDLAPASIILSTLCAELYRGEESVSDAIANILLRLSQKIQQNQGERLSVWNPANRVLEDLGERWQHNPEAYTQFKAWIFSFHRQWQSLLKIRDQKTLSVFLGDLFEEQLTQTAFREYAEILERDRQPGRLGIQSNTGILTCQASPILIPRNTFYGS
jgi:hypothetical protein